MAPADSFAQEEQTKVLDRVAMVAEQIQRFNQAERQLFARIMVRQNGASLFESVDAALGGAFASGRNERMAGEYDAAPIGKQAATTGQAYSGPGLTLDNVEAAFQSQPWDIEQQRAGDAVRIILTMAARHVLQQVPAGPLRTRALNHLIDARMIANAAITFRGRF